MADKFDVSHLKENEALNEERYDKVPYESMAFEATHPQNLYAIGKLFGLKPIDYTKAKVLELGCGAGCNLIPMAKLLPNSSFVGIDLSEIQVKQGQELVEDLKLTNINIEKKSILDFSEADGKFDYIIAHGVYSWVPPEVQEKMFEICHTNLSPRGIAYISYNVLPGWNPIKSLREMILYHTKRFSEEGEKIAQMRALLGFIKESLSNSADVYKKYIVEQIDSILKQRDSYLAHEYLELTNSPEYLYQFVERATRHKLKYLADTYVPSMYVGNLPENVQKVLNTADDIVRIEQYIDFLSNRRFRQSLLVHEHQVINRKLDPEVTDELYFSTVYVPDNGGQEIKDYSHLKFVTRNEKGNEVTTRGEITTAALCALGEFKTPAKIREIAKQAAEKIGREIDKEFLKQIKIEVLRFLLHGVIKFYGGPSPSVAKVSEKPKIYDLASYMARKFVWVPNLHHMAIGTDLGTRILLQYMDGNHTVEQLREKLLDHLEKGDINFNVEGKPVTDKEQQCQIIERFVEQRLEFFLKNALLVA